MGGARRLSSRFAALEALLAGRRERGRARWLTDRLVLVRSTEGTVAIAVAPVRQIAAFVLCGVCLAALVASVTVVGVLRAADERQVRQIVELRGEALALAERTARDRQLLERLSGELTAATAERDRTAAAAELASRAVDEETQRLAERDAALERANAVLEQADADRRRLERERDAARARHDDLVNEFGSALRELDGETRRALADVEKIIAAAGIEPRQRVGARGGPYIPWPGPASTAADGGFGGFEQAALRVERLKAMRDTLQQLPLVLPVTGAVITGGFGFRYDPFNGGSALHEGIDLQATHDPVIRAPGAGTVISAGWNGEFGNMVEIDHGFGVVTRYAHLSRLTVRRGDVVAAGHPLGVIGATGRATGAHLHYEIRVAGRPRDPFKFLHGIDVRQAGRDRH
jgi:murein DD-endopeptidase MepM/ murein hydrolase activator NlpD